MTAKNFILTLCFLIAAYSEIVAQENDKIFNTLHFKKDTAEINATLRKVPELRHVATDSLITALAKTLQMSRKINYVKGIATSLVNLGLMYMDKGQYDKSLQLYQTSIPYCRLLAVTEPRGIVLAYNNIAALYGNRNVFDSAAIYYYKALDEYDDRNLHDTLLLLNLYNNLAARLTGLDLLKEAKFYLQKTVPLSLAMSNNRMLARSYVTYSGVYISEKNWDSTRLYALKALHILDTIKDPAIHIIAYCNLAETYLKTQPHKALYYYNKAFTENKYASGVQLAPAYRGLGKAYFELKDYKNAEKYHRLALEQVKSIHSYSGLKDCYNALVSIYSATHDYKKAFEYKTNYADILDSNMNEEKLRIFGHLEVKYRTVQKDKELAQNKLLLTEQAHEIENKNIILLTVCLCFLFAILFIISAYRFRKQKEDFRTKSLKNKKELTQLKATMQGEERERVRIARELHDGIMIQFSAVKMNLSVLKETETLHNEPKLGNIINSLDEAIKDLRKSAHNLMPDMLLKEGLTEAVHYFCVKLQEGTNMEIDFQSYGDLPAIAPDYELMLYRMIQELLQNTMKHASADKVIVQINYQPDTISITVEDNGKGFNPNVVSLHKGMGLHQIKERITSLNGTFHIYENKPRGSSVYIELELNHLQQTDSFLNVHKSSYS